MLTSFSVEDGELRAEMRRLAGVVRAATVAALARSSAEVAAVLARCADELESLSAQTPLPKNTQVQMTIARAKLALMAWRAGQTA